jgi:DNA polymerase III alpha subunit
MAPAADEVLVAASADLAARLGLPLVASHPVQFIGRDDYKAHEARVCIAEGYVLGDKRRPKRFFEEQYFKTRAEMTELFADLPEALQNSVEIARRCNLSVEQMGFPGYFLIVADFIQWAKGQGIPVGPGRGSGAGSVAAWALTITDLDPLRFNCSSNASSTPTASRCPTSTSTSARIAATR